MKTFGHLLHVTVKCLLGCLSWTQCLRSVIVLHSLTLAYCTHAHSCLYQCKKKMYMYIRTHANTQYLSRPSSASQTHYQPPSTQISSPIHEFWGSPCLPLLAVIQRPLSFPLFPIHLISTPCWSSSVSLLQHSVIVDSLATIIIILFLCISRHTPCSSVLILC